MEYRAVIRYLFLKKKTNNEINTELNDVYGDSAPSILTITYWAAEFKRGRKSIFDDQRPGRLKEINTPEIVDKIHGMIIDEWLIARYLKLRAFQPNEQVLNIVHEY